MPWVAPTAARLAQRLAWAREVPPLSLASVVGPILCGRTFRRWQACLAAAPPTHPLLPFLPRSPEGRARLAEAPPASFWKLLVLASRSPACTDADATASPFHSARVTSYGDLRSSLDVPGPVELWLRRKLAVGAAGHPQAGNPLLALYRAKVALDPGLPLSSGSSYQPGGGPKAELGACVQLLPVLARDEDGGAALREAGARGAGATALVVSIEAGAVAAGAGRARARARIQSAVQSILQAAERDALQALLPLLVVVGTSEEEEEAANQGTEQRSGWAAEVAEALGLPDLPRAGLAAGHGQRSPGSGSGGSGGRRGVVAWHVLALPMRRDGPQGRPEVADGMASPLLASGLRWLATSAPEAGSPALAEKRLADVLDPWAVIDDLQLPTSRGAALLLDEDCPRVVEALNSYLAAVARDYASAQGPARQWPPHEFHRSPEDSGSSPDHACIPRALALDAGGKPQAALAAAWSDRGGVEQRLAWLRDLRLPAWPPVLAAELRDLERQLRLAARRSAQGAGRRTRGHARPSPAHEVVAEAWARSTSLAELKQYLARALRDPELERRTFGAVVGLSVRQARGQAGQSFPWHACLAELLAAVVGERLARSGLAAASVFVDLEHLEPMMTSPPLVPILATPPSPEPRPVLRPLPAAADGTDAGEGPAATKRLRAWAPAVWAAAVEEEQRAADDFEAALEAWTGAADLGTPAPTVPRKRRMESPAADAKRGRQLEAEGGGLARTPPQAAGDSAGALLRRLRQEEEDYAARLAGAL